MKIELKDKYDSTSSLELFHTGYVLRRPILLVEPDPLYRGDARGFVEIFAKGFEAQGKNSNFFTHSVFGSPANDSAFVSTSSSKEVASKFPIHKKDIKISYLYQINSKQTFTDAHKALYQEVLDGKLSPKNFCAYYKEHEKAFLSKIPPEEISGAWKVTRTSLVEPPTLFDFEYKIEEPFIPNPNYPPYKYANFVKGAGHLLTGLGVAFDGARLTYAYQQDSARNDLSFSKTKREATKISAGWLGALSLGWGGVKIGTTVCTPFGPLGQSVCAAAGGMIGGGVGYYAGDTLATKWYDAPAKPTEEPTEAELQAKADFLRAITSDPWLVVGSIGTPETTQQTEPPLQTDSKNHSEISTQLKTFVNSIVKTWQENGAATAWENIHKKVADDTASNTSYDAFMAKPSPIQQQQQQKPLPQNKEVKIKSDEQKKLEAHLTNRRNLRQAHDVTQLATGILELLGNNGVAEVGAGISTLYGIADGIYALCTVSSITNGLSGVGALAGMTNPITAGFGIVQGLLTLKSLCTKPKEDPFKKWVMETLIAIQEELRTIKKEVLERMGLMEKNIIERIKKLEIKEELIYDQLLEIKNILHNYQSQMQHIACSQSAEKMNARSKQESTEILKQKNKLDSLVEKANRTILRTPTDYEAFGRVLTTFHTQLTAPNGVVKSDLLTGPVMSPEYINDHPHEFVHRLGFYPWPFIPIQTLSHYLQAKKAKPSYLHDYYYTPQEIEYLLKTSVAKVNTIEVSRLHTSFGELILSPPELKLSSLQNTIAQFEKNKKKVLFIPILIRGFHQLVVVYENTRNQLQFSFYGQEDDYFGFSKIKAVLDSFLKVTESKDFADGQDVFIFPQPSDLRAQDSAIWIIELATELAKKYASEAQFGQLKAIDQYSTESFSELHSKNSELLEKAPLEIKISMEKPIAPAVVNCAMDGYLAGLKKLFSKNSPLSLKPEDIKNLQQLLIDQEFTRNLILRANRAELFFQLLLEYKQSLRIFQEKLTQHLHDFEKIQFEKFHNGVKMLRATEREKYLGKIPNKNDIPVFIHQNWFSCFVTSSNHQHPPSLTQHPVCNQRKAEFISSQQNQILNRFENTLANYSEAKIESQAKVSLFEEEKNTAEFFAPFILPENPKHPILPMHLGIVSVLKAKHPEVFVYQAKLQKPLSVSYRIADAIFYINIKCLINDEELEIASTQFPFNTSFYPEAEDIWWYWAGGEYVKNLDDVFWPWTRTDQVEWDQRSRSGWNYLKENRLFYIFRPPLPSVNPGKIDLSINEVVFHAENIQKLNDKLRLHDKRLRDEWYQQLSDIILADHRSTVGRAKAELERDYTLLEKFLELICPHKPLDIIFQEIVKSAPEEKFSNKYPVIYDCKTLELFLKHKRSESPLSAFLTEQQFGELTIQVEHALQFAIKADWHIDPKKEDQLFDALTEYVSRLKEGLSIHQQVKNLATIYNQLTSGLQHLALTAAGQDQALTRQAQDFLRAIKAAEHSLLTARDETLAPTAAPTAPAQTKYGKFWNPPDSDLLSTSITTPDEALTMHLK